MKILIRLNSIDFLTVFVLTLLMYSCSSDLDDLGYSTNNEHIKSISSNGKAIHRYYYDQTGKIMEESSLFYFKKYIYDENGRLVKVESAFDKSIYSSAYITQRTEFMTSKNSVADSYSLLHYDETGRLSKTGHYFNETGTIFEYRSMRTFEYEGKNIIRENFHEPTGQITQYFVYTYDENGNVTNNKNYSNLINSEDELLSETFYKYDNYNNPYRILIKTGSPGLFTNANNIIETKTIRHDDIPGIDKQSGSKTTYLYNEKGYPIKEITKDSEFEYNY